MSVLRFDDEVEGGYAPTERTLGTRIEEDQIYSIDHPSYTMFAQMLAEEIDEIAKRELAKKSSAVPIVLPYTVDPAELADLSVLYPEFNIVPVPLNQPGHTMWTASRYLGNEYLLQSADMYSTDIVHLGGAQLSCMMKAARSVHIEQSDAIPVVIHEHYRHLVDVVRVFSDYGHMATEYGVNVPRKEYDQFMERKAYGLCTDHNCTHVADVFCADLSLYAMSPDQFAAAMLQHNCSIGLGFFIYHPMMLVRTKGKLPGTEVHYNKYSRFVEFLYPDGVAGVRRYDISKWSLWLVSHCFRLPGTEAWFRLELMKNRGAFMFFRMARVDKPVAAIEYAHALELPNTGDSVLVRSWRLKRGMLSDPANTRSWTPHHFIIASRTERRVREFAMQCKPENFSRASIKKQIKMVNNRWVLSGTTVTVMPPLEPQEIEDLTTAIYAKAFVDRYSSGMLSKKLMDSLSKFRKFNSMSTFQKLAVVSVAGVNFVYKNTFGLFVDWLLKTIEVVCDQILGIKGELIVDVVRAPQYVLLKSYVGTWASVLSSRKERIGAIQEYRGLLKPDWYLPGSTFIAKLTQDTVGHCDEDLGNKELLSTATYFTDIVDTSEHTDSPIANAFSRSVEASNMLDHTSSSRFSIELSEPVVDDQAVYMDFKSVVVDDCVNALDQLYLECLPTVAYSDFTADSYSLSLDPQDRNLSAIYLKFPTYFGDAPKPRMLYRSNLRALNIPTRQNTGQELLTAIATRNLSSPALADPQDSRLVSEVWDSFLDEWCVPHARVLLEQYRSDPASLCDEGLKNWAGKAKPEVVARITKELDELSTPLESMRVGEYLAMIKADVKPSLSTKPVGNIVAPQVIVYHEKLMSALFSAIFRILVNRFLSLLKPEIMVNLRKNLDTMSDHVGAFHSFGKKCTYLENDFSQYDKSQAEFAFALEEHVFRQLGMNEQFLQQWEIGHHYSNIRCVSVGLSLHTMYQRKSGDATTAFGNVILNILTVQFAYRGTAVDWALFMGDDSLVCTSKPVVGHEKAVRVFAERFNLIAKYYITESPYFASNFLLLDENALTAKLVPDPIKRIERLSMHIAAEDPKWQDRWQSCTDTLAAYKDVGTAQKLSIVVPQRYQVSEGLVRGAAAALGTICRDFKKFRQLWKEEPELIQG
ncbi:RNA-dependent RNA polymerase [Erysiphe necator associated virga-like virus 4]|nr:RNA-dependent RNA polymerase [Erysiphe necator associated virga-like virus 4]